MGRRLRANPIKTLLSFAVFWSLVVGLFDALLVFPTIGQLAASGWPSVQGEVVAGPAGSEEAGTHRPWIEYRYGVGGRVYESDRVTLSILDRDEGRQPHIEPGKPITVYYNPLHPSTAVLRRGVTPMAWFVLLFLTPFNAVGLGFWWVIARSLWYRGRGGPGGARVVRLDMRIRLWTHRRSPVLAGLVGVGLCAFLSIFVCGFTLMRSSPPPLTQICLGLSAAAGVASMLGAVIANARSKRFVEIDLARGTIRLPKRAKRRPEPIERELGDLVRIEDESFTDESTTTSNGRPVPEFSPVLVFAGEGGEIRERIAKWMEPSRAERLADWLAAELRVPRGGLTDANEPADEDAGPEADAGDGVERTPGTRPLLAEWMARHGARIEELRGMDRGQSLAAGVGCLGGFALFWSSIVCVFIVFMVGSAMKQVHAESYPTVEGQVTAARIDESSDGEGGTTYQPAITYTYRVAGTPFENDRVRYGQVGSSDRRDSKKVLDRFPVGATVDVYFNPDNPADSVLTPGVQGVDLFSLLFLTPFILVAVGLWTGIGYSVKERIRPPSAGGVRLLRREGRIHIRPGGFPPIAAAGVAALATSFVSIFIVGFGFGFNASMAVLGVTWAVVLAASACAYITTARRLGSGARDIVIDEAAGTIRLPATEGRAEPLTIAFDDLRDLEIRERIRKGDDGEATEYRPTVVHVSRETGRQRREAMVSFTRARRAADLADWIAPWLFGPI
ncbi:MAG: DUF3592 domain-containing protein [Phycisphaeraceae bacterium]|nr:MAG: DUF3592 domain-containing protein [Phycisphaeraceae bacterium]